MYRYIVSCMEYTYIIHNMLAQLTFMSVASANVRIIIRHVSIIKMINRQDVSLDETLLLLCGVCHQHLRDDVSLPIRIG